MNTQAITATVKINGNLSPVELTLFRGMSYVLTLTLENAPALDNVISWSFAIDADFNHETALVIVADNEKITEKDNVVTIPISKTNTKRLAEVLGTFREQPFRGQLLGYNAKAEVVFSVLMTQILIINNLDGEPPTENTSEYYKKAEVNALLSELSEPSEVSEVAITSTTQTGDFAVDFGGSAVQIYNESEAVSDTLTIASVVFTEATPEANKVYTVELHIPSDGDISTIIIPDDVDIIDIPDTLECTGDLTYHVFVARYIMGCKQLNYSYSYTGD